MSSTQGTIMPEKSDNNEDSIAERLTAKLQHLMDNSLNNMGVHEMEEISERMRSLLDQGAFWIDQENFNRFAYDLQDFINWLTEFIADKDREFWGE